MTNKKWSLNLLMICVIIGFSLTHIFNIFFTSQAKSSVNLILLFALIITIIIVAYLILILSKRRQKDD